VNGFGRRRSKARAATGCCELCGKQGFPTPDGSYYLEAHHVIPMSCNGCDDERNVVAICADDHRRAHFGADRHVVREQLIWDVLYKHYPDDESFFEYLDELSLAIERSDILVRKIEEQHVAGD